MNNDEDEDALHHGVSLINDHDSSLPSFNVWILQNFYGTVRRNKTKFADCHGSTGLIEHVAACVFSWPASGSLQA